MKFCQFLIITLFSTLSWASSTDSLTSNFQAKVDAIYSVLQTKEKAALSFSQVKALAENEVLKHWDIDATLIMMIGKSHWNTIAESEKAALKQSFYQTLLRYFLEAYDYYSGQPILLEHVKMNQAKNKGWITLTVELDYMPDFPVDISIIKKNNRWLYRDIRVQGITYTSMKRNFYQTMISEHGVQKLIEELDDKNNEYFDAFAQQTNESKLSAK